MTHNPCWLFNWGIFTNQGHHPDKLYISYKVEEMAFSVMHCVVMATLLTFILNTSALLQNMLHTVSLCPMQDSCGSLTS